MSSVDKSVKVRTWDSGASGFVLSLGPSGLVEAYASEVDDHLDGSVIDPAVPPSLSNSEAVLGHRRLALLVRECFGPSSGMTRSPSVFTQSVANLYGSRMERGTLLDVGCGSLESLSWWRGKVDTVIGLDLFEGSSEVPGVEYRCIPASGAFPVETESVDFVIGIFVLEHVLDLEQSLVESHRVLRSGGTAVWITTLARPDFQVDPCLSLTHWRDFSVHQMSNPWIVPLSKLVSILEANRFTVSLWGTRFDQEATALDWRRLSVGENTDHEQVIIEARKFCP